MIEIKATREIRETIYDLNKNYAKAIAPVTEQIIILQNESANIVAVIICSILLMVWLSIGVFSLIDKPGDGYRPPFTPTTRNLIIWLIIGALLSTYMIIAYIKATKARSACDNIKSKLRLMTLKLCPKGSGPAEQSAESILHEINVLYHVYEEVSKLDLSKAKIYINGDKIKITVETPDYEWSKEYSDVDMAGYGGRIVNMNRMDFSIIDELSDEMRCLIKNLWAFEPLAQLPDIFITIQGEGSNSKAGGI